MEEEEKEYLKKLSIEEIKRLKNLDVTQIKKDEKKRRKTLLLLNSLIAILLFVGLVYLVVNLKDYAVNLYGSQASASKQTQATEEVQLAMLFWKLGLIVMVIMALIFIAVKSATRRKH